MRWDDSIPRRKKHVLTKTESAVAKEDDEKSEKDDAKEGKDAAEGGEEGASEEGEGGGKKSKKMMIIIAAVGLVVLLGGVGAGLYFTGVIGGKKEAAEAEQKQEAATPKSTAVFYSLGDILVNLSGEGKRPNYLKIKVTLELADEKDVPLMDTLKPRIIDNFQVYLRELRIEDLRGSAGLYRLREELLLRVTEAAQPVRVRDVLFQEMLVQ